MSNKRNASAPQTLAIVGAGGFFGGVIFEALQQGLPNTQLVILGRKKRPAFDKERCRFQSFDFQVTQKLPPLPNCQLLLDLSGPCKRDDGILQRLCLDANIGYIDIAVHNSHFQLKAI